MQRATIIKFHGKRTIFRSAVAALSFTLGLVCLYHAIFTPPQPEGPNNPGNIIVWLFFGGWCSAFGWHASKILDYEIDLKEGRYRLTSRFIFIKKDRWKYFNYLEYVSITSASGDVYKVNIWYHRKRKVMITKLIGRDSAVTFAKWVAKSLETRLFDHTTEEGKVELLDF